MDTGVSEGDTIPADFDSMIAKIIAYGRNRDEALGRLRRAMAQTRVVIEGGATNKSFVLDLLDQPEVIDGSADTGWIDRVRAQGRLVTHRHSTIAVAVAAIDAYEEEEQVERTRLLSTAAGGRPQVQHQSGRPHDLKLRGVAYRVRVARIGAHRFRIGVEAGGDMRAADVDLERFDQHTGQIVVNGSRFRIVTGTHGPVYLVDVEGVTHRITRDEGGVVRSPAPALVVATPVAVGDEVEAGAPILVLESMKMETVLRAPFRARLKECEVAVGSQVETGAPLLRLEPLADDAEDTETASTATVELELPGAAAPVRPNEGLARSLQDLRSLLLGFDVDPHDEQRVLDDYLAVRRAAGEDHRRPLAEEVELVELFSDLAELSHNRSDDGGQGHLHSAREYFHTYLQSLDVERAGLPESYRAKLAKALAHYGVTELDRTPDLEAAVFRIFLAQQRPSDTVTVITSLLREWLREPTPERALREPVGLALERLVAATQIRFPGLADLARGVAYAWYGHPLLLRNRARVYTTVRKHMSFLDAQPDSPERSERIADMVRATEPLVRLLGQRLVRGNADSTVMLEVLTRRYYGNKDLTDVRAEEAAGHTFVVAERRGVSLVSAAVSFDELDTVLRGLAEVARAGASVEADIYLAWEKQPEDFEAMAAALQEKLSTQSLPDQVHRITCTVAGSGGAVMHHHFTFRPATTGMTEERLIRGLHPYIAQRMQMRRLRKFDLTRLPSSDDEEVYLFRAVAKDNPNDDRLIAFAQVRDLTALREHDGRLVVLPTAENTIATCLDSIRRAQAQRPSNKRFNTNRVVMYIWPPVEVTRTELRDRHRRARAADDRGRRARGDPAHRAPA